MNQFIVREPNYNLKTISKASSAAQNLFKWVDAIKSFYKTYQEILPLRASLEDANKILADAEAELK